MIIILQLELLELLIRIIIWSSLTETKIYILSPIIRGQKGEFRREIGNIKKHGFQRVFLNGELCEIDELPKIDKNKKHTIEVIVDRIVINDDLGNRVAESLEMSLQMADGITYIEIVDLPEGCKLSYKNGTEMIPMGGTFLGLRGYTF